MVKPFYETFGDMYRFLADPHPQLEPISPIVSFTLASHVSYMLTRGVQATSKHVVDKVVPGFHEHVLPKLEKTCNYGIPIAVGIAAVFSPEFREMVDAHWTYAGGWLGIYTGGSVAVDEAKELRKLDARDQHSPNLYQSSQ